jgi:hypothetical protein
VTYPESKAVETWKRDGLSFSIVRHDSGRHFCGYVRFSARPVIEDGCRGVLSYVPVHGGITYAHQDDAGMVYGFDCAHAGDDEDPRVADLAWLRAECERMGLAIQEAAKIEADYLRNDGHNEERAAILDAYRKRMGEAGCDEGFNMSVAIAMLGGKL